MSCNPVTAGAGSSSLPTAAFNGTAAEITTITASIPSCLSSSLDANSDLNTWLQVMAAQICQNDADIATNLASIGTINSTIATIQTNVATNAAGIAANLVSIGSINSAIITIEDDIQDNVDAIQANAAAIAALDVRIDALEAVGGITDGTSGGGIPYWTGTAWSEIPVADIAYDPAGGGIEVGSPSGPDAILSLRGTATYTNIFETQNTSGDIVFSVPRATSVVGTVGRDFFIQETGTAAKGFVTKDRTSGTYKRIYVNNNAIAIESY